MCWTALALLLSSTPVLASPEPEAGDEPEAGAEPAAEPGAEVPPIVENTPPVLASLSIGPDRPRAGDTLRCAAGDVSDADGDDAEIDDDFHFREWRAMRFPSVSRKTAI